MKNIFPPLLGALLCLALPVPAELPSEPREPLRVILDTDIGNDVDDALALAMLHAFQSRRECRLLAVTLSKDSVYAVAFVDLVNTFYGRGDIPIGRVRQGKTPEPGKFLEVVAESQGTDGRPLYARQREIGAQVPEAVALLRNTLAAQPDASVVIIQIGFFTNLARLLDSPPDEVSPLAGRELVARKVKLVSMMAGHFQGDGPGGGKEFNVVMDIPAARKVFNEWPTPLYVSPWELGRSIKYPAVSIERDYAYVLHHPIPDAYRLYMNFPYDRPTYDLTSALFAVRPDRGYFTVSAAGRVQVTDEGKTQFIPAGQGRHYVISATDEQKTRTLEAMIELSSQPPDGLHKGATQ